MDDARTRFIEPALRGPHLLKISRSIPSTFTLVEQPLGPSSWMEPKTLSSFVMCSPVPWNTVVNLTTRHYRVNPCGCSRRTTSGKECRGTCCFCTSGISWNNTSAKHKKFDANNDDVCVWEHASLLLVNFRSRFEPFVIIDTNCNTGVQILADVNVKPAGTTQSMQRKRSATTKMMFSYGRSQDFSLTVDLSSLITKPM